jgi:hypothetical protein
MVIVAWPTLQNSDVELYFPKSDAQRLRLFRVNRFPDPDELVASGVEALAKRLLNGFLTHGRRGIECVVHCDLRCILDLPCLAQREREVHQDAIEGRLEVDCAKMAFFT